MRRAAAGGYFFSEPSSAGGAPLSVLHSEEASVNEADRAILFVTHRDALLRFARRLSATGDDAEEMVQDVAVVVFSHRSGPPDAEAFAGWCCGVARHLAAHRRRSHARGYGRHEDAAGVEEDPAVSTADNPEHAAIVRQELAARLEGLDTAAMTLLLDRFLLEETSSEIAKRKNVSCASVRMRVARLVATLRTIDGKSTGGDDVGRYDSPGCGNFLSEDDGEFTAASIR
jgi:RNA polymerase sigma factor (sigma-70 family)